MENLPGERAIEIHRRVIISMVAFQMKWTTEKATLWIDTENPLFGNVVPMDMIKWGRSHKVYEFIDNAREERNEEKK